VAPPTLAHGGGGVGRQGCREIPEKPPGSKGGSFTTRRKDESLLEGEGGKPSETEWNPVEQAAQN